jgi:hypothetical protein
MIPKTAPGGTTGQRPLIPSVSLITARTGASTKPDELGMRPMQARAYGHRGSQYLLIKSPPASGKSRALMFIALDKLANQRVKQAIIIVPEMTIGSSFADEPLTTFGFWADWTVKPHWNLCNAPGSDNPEISRSKVKALAQFLASDDTVLVCTHATFRFAVDDLGIEAFDDRLVAVDEIHHVSTDPKNQLGSQLAELIARDKVHIVAMTGSYFRGDAVAVLSPADESKFDTVTYTYYEQLNGYSYLKSLELGYYFYTGTYLEAIELVLDPVQKTIVHIPSVNARESTKDKLKEVEDIMNTLGTWEGVDPATGFHRVKRPNGEILKVADLVDDDVQKRAVVSAALKDAGQKNNRAHVDIIIALGMAKEGFDWIWCEHALTAGYRSSLTEIIQIIGRATRDAPGKEIARFTNLIAEPDASEAAVTDAINDTLKAIAASLLMEQVIAPRFEFTAKNAGAKEGFDYGDGGYKPGETNIGVNEATGQLHLEMKNLIEPKSPEARRAADEDLNEIIADFLQDPQTLQQGMFNHDAIPEETTQLRMGKIVRGRYPELSEDDQEAIRQRAVAALTITQEAQKPMGPNQSGEAKPNTSFVDGVRRFAMDVRELDIDLIDRINPFGSAYAVLAKAMNESVLKQVHAAISARSINLTVEEARELAVRAAQFKREHGRLPVATSHDPWERRMAEGIAFLQRHVAKNNQ